MLLVLILQESMVDETTINNIKELIFAEKFEECINLCIALLKENPDSLELMEGLFVSTIKLWKQKIAEGRKNSQEETVKYKSIIKVLTKVKANIVNNVHFAKYKPVFENNFFYYFYYNLAEIHHSLTKTCGNTWLLPEEFEDTPPEFSDILSYQEDRNFLKRAAECGKTDEEKFAALSLFYDDPVSSTVDLKTINKAIDLLENSKSLLNSLGDKFPEEMNKWLLAKSEILINMNSPPEEVLFILNKAIKFEDNLDAHILKSILFDTNNDFERALAAINEVSIEKLKDAEKRHLFYLKAHIEDEMKDYSAEIKTVKELIRLEKPDNSIYSVGALAPKLISLYILNGDYELAQKELEKISQNQNVYFPKTVYYYLAGIVKKYLKITNDANNYFKLAVKKKPDPEYSLRNLCYFLSKKELSEKLNKKETNESNAILTGDWEYFYKNDEPTLNAKKLMKLILSSRSKDTFSPIHSITNTYHYKPQLDFNDLDEITNEKLRLYKEIEAASPREIRLSLKLIQSKKNLFLQDIDKTHFEQMLDSTESLTLEFKKSLAWSLDPNVLSKKDSDETKKYGKYAAPFIVAKTLCAFLNAGGGSLILGALEDSSNGKNIRIGIEPDLCILKQTKDTCNYSGQDGYKRFVQDKIIKKYFPKEMNVFFDKYIKVGFYELSGKTFCEIIVQKSPEPVLITDQELFFIRSGSETQELRGKKEIADYIHKHFKN